MVITPYPPRVSSLWTSLPPSAGLSGCRLEQALERAAKALDTLPAATTTQPQARAAAGSAGSAGGREWKGSTVTTAWVVGGAHPHQGTPERAREESKPTPPTPPPPPPPPPLDASSSGIGFTGASGAGLGVFEPSKWGEQEISSESTVGEHHKTETTKPPPAPLDPGAASRLKAQLTAAESDLAIARQDKTGAESPGHEVLTKAAKADQDAAKSKKKADEMRHRGETAAAKETAADEEARHALKGLRDSLFQAQASLMQATGEGRVAREAEALLTPTPPR